MGSRKKAITQIASRGLGYSLAYTYSKTTDDGSSRLEILPNAYDDSGYYGTSALDHRSAAPIVSAHAPTINGHPSRAILTPAQFQ